MQGLTHLSSPWLMCLAQEVCLEGNSLTSCAGLSGLLSAQEVNLKGNKISVVDVELARLSRLTTINLDGNRILPLDPLYVIACVGGCNGVQYGLHLPSFRHACLGIVTRVDMLLDQCISPIQPVVSGWTERQLSQKHLSYRHTPA